MTFSGRKKRNPVYRKGREQREAGKEAPESDAGKEMEPWHFYSEFSVFFVWFIME